MYENRSIFPSPTFSRWYRKAVVMSMLLLMLQQRYMSHILYDIQDDKNGKQVHKVNRTCAVAYFGVR